MQLNWTPVRMKINHTSVASTHTVFHLSYAIKCDVAHEPTSVWWWQINNIHTLHSHPHYVKRNYSDRWTRCWVSPNPKKVISKSCRVSSLVCASKASVKLLERCCSNKLNILNQNRCLGSIENIYIFLTNPYLDKICWVNFSKTGLWALLAGWAHYRGTRCKLSHHNEHFDIRTKEIGSGAVAGRHSKGREGLFRPQFFQTMPSLTAWSMLTSFVQTLQVGVVFVYLDLPQRSSKKRFAKVIFISQKLSCGTVVEAEYSKLLHLKTLSHNAHKICFLG